MYLKKPNPITVRYCFQVMQPEAVAFLDHHCSVFKGEGAVCMGFVCTCMYIRIYIHVSLLRILFGSSEIPEKLHSFQVESNHTAVRGSEISVKSL